MAKERECRGPARPETQDAVGRPVGRRCSKQVNGGPGRGPPDSDGQPGERTSERPTRRMRVALNRALLAGVCGVSGENGTGTAAQ